MTIKQKKHRQALVLAVLFATAAASGYTCAEDIKLGFNGDLSASPSALSGKAAVFGIQAAIEDINASGGVLGRKLSLVTRDDLSQPQKSMQNMSELIDAEKVVAVIGPTNSGNALAWKHIANEKKIPVIGAIGSATAITFPMSKGASNYMFRVSMVDRDSIAALLAYVSKNPGSKKIGFMVETTGFGQGGLKDIEELAQLHQIVPACSEKFGVADTDMTSQLNKCKAAGVDTLIVWAQAVPSAQLMRSMEKISYAPTTLMSWGIQQPSFYEIAGSTAMRPIFLQTLTDERTPRQQKLFERIAPKMPTSPFGIAGHAYDAVLLLAAAIKQANSTEGVKVRDALENLQGNVDGVMKTYAKPFSAINREALSSSDYRWVKWRDGKLVAYSDPVIKTLLTVDYKK
ncbi:ABC transporter substrate-binding protein [Glaciimonas immobilis]|uniref:Branched-chain amino acid transport system substrate-binding protein n=1 Tax=Glaciimonas immobilis TaxID=728004 RepID=A0A840RWD9_9BURK|nr:ABC transporter substrate-binding protein [Glaciimonas immobilis]KAF3996465.1 ABC transporter substrate-binding protein [Glaciimonas immobilis]MBB5201186.1 branched-chain amino acid transport system substrate-binding protein [Glaciimonas immobilis]